MSNYMQKFRNYEKAITRLNEGIEQFDKADTLQRDGLIQRFEFAFE